MAVKNCTDLGACLLWTPFDLQNSGLETRIDRVLKVSFSNFKLTGIILNSLSVLGTAVFLISKSNYRGEDYEEIGGVRRLTAHFWDTTMAGFSPLLMAFDIAFLLNKAIFYDPYIPWNFFDSQCKLIEAQTCVNETFSEGAALLKAFKPVGMSLAVTITKNLKDPTLVLGLTTLLTTIALAAQIIFSSFQHRYMFRKDMIALAVLLIPLAYAIFGIVQTPSIEIKNDMIKGWVSCQKEFNQTENIWG